MNPPERYSDVHEELCAQVRAALPYVTIGVATRQVGNRFIDPKQIQIRWCDGPTQADALAVLVEAIPGTNGTGYSPRPLTFPAWTMETDNAVLDRTRSVASIAVAVINNALAGRAQPTNIATQATQGPASDLARVAAVLLADGGRWDARWNPPAGELVETAVARAEAATGLTRPDTYAYIVPAS